MRREPPWATSHRGLAIAAAIAGALAGGPATARTMQQKLTQACAADVARYCPGAPSDPDAIKACLLTHRDDASSDCMRMLDAAE